MASTRDELYKDYLEEMQSLENFRVSYTSVRPGAQVEREDPDVRRLIDAMAFLTARTRTSVLRNLLTTQRRLFEQYFSFLLTPMPSVGLLQAQPTGRFVETTVIPRGAEVLVTPDGAPGALFHTVSDLKVMPIKLEAIDTLLRQKAGSRVVMTFRARFPRNEEVGTLPLFVSHLDEYRASLGVLWNLKTHLESASVVFGDEKVDDLTQGVPCDVSYGAPEDPDALPELTHPLQRIREFFHTPQRELYFNIKVPKAPPQWQQFSVILDLDASWPRSLRLNAEMFQLFTIPISNLKRSMASPIACTGQKDRYALRFPTPAQKFALHSVVGAFELKEGGALSPLKPGVIAGGSGSYEIERTEQGDFVQITFPEAFEKPRKVAVDAFWIQPWFSERASSKLKVALHSRNIVGVQLELRGEMRPHVENRLGQDFDRMLQLLALRSKTIGFGRDDLDLMVGSLGVSTGSPYKQLLPTLITDLAVKVLRRPKEAGGARHLYTLRLPELETGEQPLVEAALAHLHALLKSWTNDAEVKLEVSIEGVEDKLEF